MKELRKFIGESESIKKVLKKINKISKSDATVVFYGETGTGKSLLAEYIHFRSPRSDGKFIGLNSCAIPDDLIESELFGHEKGAFTGANEKREGKVWFANKGTLFLDEIGDMSPSVQCKLLKILDTGNFFRLGGHVELYSNFRLICATNLDLQELKEKKFRKDLFYRINTIPITIPPLRDRGEDINLLGNHFLEKFILKYEKTEDQKEIKNNLEKYDLREYDWPGNVRELKSIIERFVLTGSTEIDFLETKVNVNSNKDKFIEGVLRSLKENSYLLGDTPIIDLNQLSLDSIKRVGLILPDREAIENYERGCMELILEACGNNKNAAKFYGISRTGFHERLHKLEERDKNLRLLWPQSVPVSWK